MIDEKLRFLLENENMLDDFLKLFYDTQMLTELLQERIAERDVKTVEAMMDFISERDEEYTDWEMDQRIKIMEGCEE